MNLDEKIKELSEIVKKLEQDDVTFEEGIILFEKGVEISKETLTALNTAKGKITQIKQDLETFKEEELK